MESFISGTNHRCRGLRMFKATLIWAAKVPILIGLTLIAYVMAPVFALFVTHAEESEVTGFPSMYPGKAREFLIEPLRVWQSQDAPLDEWWYGNYEMDSWRHNFDQDDYDSSWLLRYACRIAWLWRNPAYGFGSLLGYDGAGLKFIGFDQDDDTPWLSGKTCSQLWKCTNDRGETGWLFRARIYFYKNRCLEVMAGYKLFSDPTSKYVAMRFNPFRQYPK